MYLFTFPFGILPNIVPFGLYYKVESSVDFLAWRKKNRVFIFLGRIDPWELPNFNYQITKRRYDDFNKVLQLKFHPFFAFIASCEAELLRRWFTKQRAWEPGVFH